MQTLAKRVRTLSHCKAPSSKPGGVVYWMSRDQRAQDNWALLHARNLALKHRVGLSVIFCILPTFENGRTSRTAGFMLKGLAEVETELRSLGIPFRCLQGDPVEELPAFVKEHDACALVADFSPLRNGLQWKSGVCNALPEDVPLYEVDTHNVVPVWLASDKQEVGARTIRKKITDQLPQFLVEIPKLEGLPEEGLKKKAKLLHSSASLLAACGTKTDWAEVRNSMKMDESVPEITWCEPGYKAGMAQAESFVSSRLRVFADKRNDPNVKALSDLSPYYHFGQISPHRVALLVKKGGSKSQPNGTSAFLEESIVRRELADNFCYYQPNYDNLGGAANWARESLELHAKDKRDHLYTLEELESAKSHEDIWNAAQRQMVATGKMHGFMRMYWAKKILEWSPSPAEALSRAIYLNDKYSIDGRDPNGYVGCAWSIMGTHDMGWAERPIFGKIRFMNYNGCKRKFDLGTYVGKWGSGPIKSAASLSGDAAVKSSSSPLAKAFSAGAGAGTSSNGKKKAAPVVKTEVQSPAKKAKTAKPCDDAFF